MTADIPVQNGVFRTREGTTQFDSRRPSRRIWPLYNHWPTFWALDTKHEAFPAVPLSIAPLYYGWVTV